MINKIQSQIDNITESLEWIKKNKPQDFDQKYLQLVEENRKLRILKNAERYNPGIAAFGQSQVGKSYLMNCILQNTNEPFMVEAEGKSHNFVEEINPIGEGQEATGVVTRFSSYERNKDEYKLKYPIRMRVLTIRDIIAVIVDTYFIEFGDYTTLGENEINTLCEEWMQKYLSMPLLPNPCITSADILDIKHYCKKYVNNAQVYSTKTSFFETLALIIERIPLMDYADIFSVLWNHQAEYTKLFNKSLDILSRLKYQEYIYLPIESVLHNGTKEDTIMSVSCLKLLYTNQETLYRIHAYYSVDNTFVDLGEFTKTELCTVCSEVIIKITDNFIATSGTYDKSQMTESSKSKLPDGQQTFEVLRKTDLLDFPGARARGNMCITQIQQHDNLMYSLLRGKIAYLFNKYNDEKIINILMLCHHHKNVEAPQLWQLIEGWVKEYVGNTPEQRNKYIQKIGIPPLFHVGTMYNLNLNNPDNGTVGKSDTSIYSRWKGRFVEKLIGECFRKADWVSNWTGTGVPFQNCYMLRDFNFSKAIFKGWDENGCESDLAIDEDYFERMRENFIACNNEHHLFENPKLIWDVASTRNNDGALYILQQLAKASANIDSARELQIEEQLNICSKAIYNIMRDYHVSTNVDELLEGNIRKARAIFREMDFACNSDNYYFGHLIQALQITEPETYKVVHKIIQSPEIIGKVNNFSDYEIILSSCRNHGYPIETAKDVAEKWQCVMKTYGFITQTEAEDFLQKKNINTTDLFSPSFKRKLNSCVIADAVYNHWCSKIKAVDFLNEFTNKGDFDPSIMTSLVDQIIASSIARKIADRMASLIAAYVNVVDIHTVNESLISDILADVIQDFVIDFGFEYLSDDDKEKARKVCQSYHIPAFNFIEKELPGKIEEAELTNLFNEMSTNPKALLPSFEDSYHRWLEAMFISYVTNLEVPDFDREANQVLEVLLGKIMTA